MNNNSIKAGLWEGTSRNGNKCYKGKITINNKLYYMFLVPCTKSKDNSPDFQMYLSEEMAQQGNAQQPQYQQSYQQNYQPFAQPQPNAFSQPMPMPTPNVDNVKPSDMPTFGNYSLNENNLPF